MSHELQRTANARVVVIDAGVGNLGNLERAVRRVVPGCSVEVTDQAQVVAQAEVLLLPGVGAFRPPRERLRGALEEALRETLDRGGYLLGICVGFQLLFEESDEFGSTDGLGLLPGRIAALPAGVQRPHIGWNRLLDCGDHPLTAGLAGDYTYFVHGYAPRAVPDEFVLASCLHGVRFPAIVADGRVMGTQFHPEKSGAVGLGLLANFFRLAGVVQPKPESSTVADGVASA